MVPDPSVTPPGSGVGKTSQNASKPSGSSRNESSQASQPRQASEADEGNQEQSSSAMDTEEMQETADLLNKTSNVLNRNLRFKVLQEENVVQAEIVNQEKDEVIQKIPPDELIELRKTIDTFIGMFVDEMR